jgi:hypothetical protein
VRHGAKALLVLSILTLHGAACTNINPVTLDGPSPSGPATYSDADLDAVLQRFVDREGRVDYTGLAKDPAQLDAYYALIARVSPDSHPALFPTDDARLAYWINAYNAAALKTVLRHYPIESVKDVRSPALFFLPRLAGFFYLQQITLGNEKTNLYDLEMKLILKRFADPRIHFALNCASISCPRLPRHAFTATALRAELAAETDRFVSEERNVEIDPVAGQITLSSIFDWYEDDFVSFSKSKRPGDEPSLIGYLEPLLTPSQTAALAKCAECEVRFREYDWGLNDQSTH